MEIDGREQWLEYENFRGLKEVEEPNSINDGLGAGTYSV